MYNAALNMTPTSAKISVLAANRPAYAGYLGRASQPASLSPGLFGHDMAETACSSVV